MSVLEITATITVRQTLLAKGLSFKHLKSRLEVVSKSLLRRKRMVAVAHQNGFTSRVVAWPANLMSRCNLYVFIQYTGDPN